MKTKKQWEKSGLDLDEFLGEEPCRIDEDLYNYIGEAVAPNWCCQSFVQLGEAEKEDEDIPGLMYYTTATHVGDRYFYLGILPDFNK